MADLIDRESLLEKVQFRIEPKGIVGETVRDMVEKTREIILNEPVATDNNDGCKWIPVTERLPEDDLPKCSKVKQIKVLTVLKSDKGVRTVRSQMRFRCTWYSDTAPWAWKYSCSEITHWMPLPEPPKEADNA